MATYQSTQVHDGMVFSQAPSGTEAVALGNFLITPARTPVVGDVWQFVKIKAGMVLTDIHVWSGDVDTNGTPTFAGSFGFSSASGASDAGLKAAAVYGSGFNDDLALKFQTDGYLVLAEDTTLYFKVTAVAATFNAAFTDSAPGKAFMVARFVSPVTSTMRPTP